MSGYDLTESEVTEVLAASKTSDPGYPTPSVTGPQTVTAPVVAPAGLTAGIHAVGESEYHADPCAAPSLSSSIAKLLCDRTPLHAWTAHPRLNPLYVSEEKEAFDIGTTAHALLLGEHDGVKVVVVEADSWRTKAAQEERDEARTAGKTPILAKHWSSVQAMVEAAVALIDSLDVDPPVFTAGKAEQTIVWDEAGVTCRARIDWLHDDRTAIDDYKTTSASADPKKWTRTMMGFGGDVQAAFYLRGLRAMSQGGLLNSCEFRFVVQETSPPYALSVVSLAPDALALADAKVEYAIETWRRCLAADKWPAYPTRVCYAESSAWQEADWHEREELAKEATA